MNDELTLNVTGWLHNILEQGMVSLPSNQAQNVLNAKQWLADVNTSKLLVAPAPEEPSSQN